jgi:hypothetical protein
MGRFGVDWKKNWFSLELPVKLTGMPSITLRAHFDGKNVVLDEPYTFDQDDTLLITVLSNKEAEERQNWMRLSSGALNAAYGEDEPEYSVLNLIEENPHYDRG